MDEGTESLHRYGTPLEPLEEDEVLTKKPINVEDQIVTDENGKRRFHGAFTGGFSAGFWNTVGSLEGWKPTNFKSSRSEKAPQRATQKPQDFMDDEDLGEFGIAPQRIEITSDYQIEGRKRKFMQPSLVAVGPIPGEPALASLLQPIVKDKIAVRILKSMGWKPGQGIGPRLTAKEKKRARARNKREEYILRKYADDDNNETGTSANVANRSKTGSDNSIDDEDGEHDDNNDSDDDEITFAPDDYEPLICRVKIDRFGLGYTSLRESERAGTEQSAKKLQRFELFAPLEMSEKLNKKLSITGQAFGVGALEEEDDDIYARDDLSKYDFSLDDGKQKPKVTQKYAQDKHIIKGFSTAQDSTQFQKPFLIELPNGFLPRNWALRRSRFAPLSADKARELEDSVVFRKRGLGRHDLDPDLRGTILEDKQNETQQIVQAKPSLEDLQMQQRTRNERTRTLLERITSKADNFTRGGIINTEGEEISKQTDEMKKTIEKEQKSLLAKANEKTKNLGSKPNEFKPFLNNDAKQQRYEKFLEANLSDEAELTQFLATIQPIELSEWDREMEKKEFIQARNIYKPLGGVMSERFVSETSLQAEKPKIESTSAEKSDDTKKITMERTKEMWKPHALLCKRYNIAEPFGGTMDDVDARPAKKAKLSIFDYLETSVNTKANFQTPVIIPKHIEKPKPLIDNTSKARSSIGEVAEIKNSANETLKNSTKPLVSADITMTEKKATEQRHFKLPAQTELEKRVEESRDKPPSEKVELFRAIFEDSDEDEAEMNANDATAVIETQLELPSTSKSITAAAANLLRNTSPPRGIFAALFSSKNQTAAVQPTPIKEKLENEEHIQRTLENKTATKITFKSRAVRQQEETEADAYGPILPKNLKPTESKPPTTTNALDARLLTLMGKHPTVEDVWIERLAGESEGTSDQSSSDSDSSDSNANKSKRKKLKKAKKTTSDKKKLKKSAKKKAKSKKKHESEHKRLKLKQKKKKHK